MNRDLVGLRSAFVAVVILLAITGFVAVNGFPFGGDEAHTDLTFRNVTGEVGLDYQFTALGTGNGNSGVYVADVDNDGWEDLLVVGGESPVLYANTGGQFERSDALPGLSREFKSATFVDVEGDGWTELLLFSRNGDVASFRNHNGTYERTDYGLGNLTYPLGAAAADYDGDGDTDLFVYQSGNWRMTKPAGYFSLHAHVEDDNGNPNILYENVGSGEEARFERVDDAGISGERWSLAASFVDLTGDGLPDIHVANDYNNDTIYVNQGNGTFTQQLLGGATARNGMSSEVADVTDDGAPDVFVTNIYLPFESAENKMSKERYDRLRRLLTYVIQSGRTKGNTLLINQGNGVLVDRADEFGVRRGGWGWAATFTDFDNDGDRDLLHTTQKVARLDPNRPKWTLPQLWQRTPDGFERVNHSIHGIDEHDSRGMATGDYDLDGDRDVIIATHGGPVLLYENTVNGGNSLAFRIVDEQGATALGASVRVEYGEESTTVRQTSQTDFLSQESRMIHVGLGTIDEATLHVTWPDGTRRTFENVAANQRLRVSISGVERITTTADDS